MSLPNGFTSSHEYFRHVNEFLRQNSWIYREANTQFIKAGILDEMPLEFRNYFSKIPTQELNTFPYAHHPMPNLEIKALINFRQELAKFIPVEAYSEPKYIERLIELENIKRINIKKQHEIQRLATTVKATLKINNQQKLNKEEKAKDCVLIDFGSGLGYLSELLYKLRVNENLLVLGLEADSYRVEAAKKRINTYMPAAIKAIQYRQHFITEDSKDFIARTVGEVFKLNYQEASTKMAIIGLHACADLTITSMKLFLQLPQVQHLIIMPCCYHKLQLKDECDAADDGASSLKFKNFPLSASLKRVLSGNKDQHTNNDSVNYLNRPFLRLACQQTLKRWSKCTMAEHQAHGTEMFFRAAAELLKEEEEPPEQQLDLMIVKRKNEKIDLSSLSIGHAQNFETFSRIFALKSKTTNKIVEWSERHRTKFSKIVEKYPDGAEMAEGLTCLQTSMQKLCENLVLYDRLCFMEEKALQMDLKITMRYEKIMDEELSPRCYVLIAEKL